MSNFKQHLAWALCIIALCVTMAIADSCDAAEWVQPPAAVVHDVPKQVNVGLNYTEHNGRLYLKDADDKPYGLVDLRTGVVTVYGPGARVRLSDGSVIVGRVR